MSRNPTSFSIPVSKGDSNSTEVEVINEPTMQESEMSSVSGTEGPTSMDVDSDEASADIKHNKSSNTSTEDLDENISSSILIR